ncbi:MAG: purine-binding chemotaxis protein CheW [Kiritimatiellae bacterium]|nr:purine-binding chemotaxis protein CheW [Kiritimatiellia bacterium]
MTENTAAKGRGDHAGKTAQPAGKYLTFKLAEEEYAVGILKVEEIIGLQPITRVPRTPPFVRGVVNLRGRVIPVIDLRLKFGLETQEATDRTCIIVLQITRESGLATLGAIVDEVLEVMDVPAEQIAPTPAFGTNVNTSFIQGIAKIDNTVTILLDIEKVLSSDEIVEISTLGAASTETSQA